MSNNDIAAIIAQNNALLAMLQQQGGTAVAEAPTPAPTPAQPATPKAAPAARRLAKDLDVSLADITGTGSSGYITVADIERHCGLMVSGKTAAPVARAARVATPAPLATPAPAATAEKAKKTALETQTFTGGGVSVVIEKFAGKRSKRYAVMTSPDDATMRVYLRGRTIRVIAMLLRSAAAQDAVNFLADCQ